MKIQMFNPAEVVANSAEMEFCELGSYDAGGAGVFWSSEGGPSPWEMHPDCDELLHAIDGEIEIEILPDGGGESTKAVLKPGWYLVVPKGCWHRQYMRTAAKEFYVTPGATVHSNADDPRQGD